MIPKKYKIMIECPDGQVREADVRDYPVYKKAEVKVTLKPEHYQETADECVVVFEKDEIVLNVKMDNNGNTFKLPHSIIKKYIKM